MRIASMMLLAGVTALACARPDPDSSAMQGSGVAPLQMAADSGISAFLHGGPVDIGSSRSSIAERLGTPDSVTAHTVANRHDPSMTDSVFHMYYSGLTAELYRAGYDGKEMLTGLEIRDAQYITPAAAVRPGTSVAELLAEFGEPADSADNELHYVCEACLVSGHETVHFILARGAVRAIRIQYWID